MEHIQLLSNEAGIFSPEKLWEITDSVKYENEKGDCMTIMSGFSDRVADGPGRNR